MIDLKTELQNFPHIDLEKLLEKHANIPDNIRNSIMFYNKAADSIKIGSEDIAIIELKKAIHLNPDFHEAMNLLGICYLYINEKEKAEEMFSRVIDSERNGIKAMELLNNTSDNLINSLSTEKVRQSSVKRLDAVQLGSSKKSQMPKNKATRILFTGMIIGSVVGFIIVMIVSSLLNVFFGSNSKLENVGKVSEELSALQEKYDRIKGNLQDSLKANEDYSEMLKEYENKIPPDENSGMFLEAVGYAFLKKDIQAADLLVTLDVNQLSDKETELYSKVRPSIMQQASNAAYFQANSYGDKTDFDNAALYYEKVLSYKVANSTQMPATLYYLGKAYESLEEDEKAKDAYKKILIDYPQSQFKAWAESRLKYVLARLDDKKQESSPEINQDSNKSTSKPTDNQTALNRQTRATVKPTVRNINKNNNVIQTTRPTKKPTPKPTQRPTLRPTPKPTQRPTPKPTIDIVDVTANPNQTQRPTEELDQ